MDTLTNREWEVIYRRCQGWSVEETANDLRIEGHSVKEYTRRVNTKLGLSRLGVRARLPYVCFLLGKLHGAYHQGVSGDDHTN